MEPLAVLGSYNRTQPSKSPEASRPALGEYARVLITFDPVYDGGQEEGGKSEEEEELESEQKKEDREKGKEKKETKKDGRQGE